MPSPSRTQTLTRTEAQARERLLTIIHTSVELDLVEDSDTFPSTTTITVECAADGAETFLDLKADSLQRAEINGQPVDPNGWQDGRLALTELRAGRNEITVEATMRYVNDGEGLHRHVAPDGHRYLYAMSFLDNGPRWFACFDQPDLKSPYTFTVAAPADWVVRGNGPAEEVSSGQTPTGPIPTSQTPTGPTGVRTWRLHQPVPLSTYFVTLLAGPYAEVRDEHDGIPLGLYARADLARELQEQAADIVSVTKACFDAYHQLFGVRYPFGEYHQAFVPDFNAGAMENPGCITFRDQYIFRGAATHDELGRRACTIAHEMAHQWFGDLVTMRWWDDLWLNESFAELMGHLVCSRATPYDRWLDFGISRKDWGMLADQSSSTHPVAGNGTADAEAALQQFDGISYAKGAATLRQFLLYAGEDTFLAGLRDYFTRYGRGNAEFADLLECWRSAGVTDIDEFADAWLRTSGVDELAGAADGPDRAVVHRTPPRDDDGTRPHTVTVLRLDKDGAVRGEAPARLGTAPADPDADLDASPDVNPDASPDTHAVQAALPGRRDQVTLPGDHGLVIADGHDESWARVAIDWEAAPPIAAVADPRTRLVLYNALRDGVRHARLAPADAADLLTEALAVEEQVPFLTELGRFWLGSLCGPYCPPTERAARRRTAAGVLSGALAESPAGSDRQLAAFRLAISATADPTQLAGWLDGDLPAGLDPDPELHWAIATRLVALTGDVAVIEASLAADDSSAGRVHAARARAAIPTREAKDAAFRILLTDTGAPAYEVYAAAEGFFLSHQHELTADYVSRWFAGIDRTRDFRQGWALARVTMLSFPGGHVDADTVAAADRLVADPATHQAVRREIADGLDQLRRALASLERFH